MTNDSKKLFGIAGYNYYGSPNGFSAEGITSFLTWRYPIGELTMFQGLKKISRVNWYPKFTESKVTFEEAQNTIEKLLIKSVVNLTKNKKIGFLIGGLDSTLILALYRKIYPEAKIHSYTARFTNGEDESFYTEKIAKLFNSQHTTLTLTREDYIGKSSLLAPLINIKKEPLHPNEIALCNLMLLAKKDGCDAVLCGEGADDIFGGYTNNWTLYKKYKGEENFHEFFLKNYRYFTIEDRWIINEKYLCDDIELLQTYICKEFEPAIEYFGAYFTQLIHTPGLINRAINAGKLANIEVCFPYTDFDLVEYVNSTPFAYKIHNEEGKFILKKLSEKYLPAEFVYRRKIPFPVPFDIWLQDIRTWNLNLDVFNSRDISTFSGWKKFMLINLNTFLETQNEFNNISCGQR